VKVKIDHDRDGWHYSASNDLKSSPFATYPEAVRAALAGGHEIDNAGWRHRMLSWNWHSHAIEGYPGWEIEIEESPAFVKLTHKRGVDAIESHEISTAWDDTAAVDFYQRDWTNDGIPFVREGEIYWSGWWFATIAERDRFLEWHHAMDAR
jgi:hypothetical protein